MASDDLATKLGIATYIGNGNGRSIYDIAEHFGISVRTAYRFLDRLQAEGYPLTNEERRNGKEKLWTMLDLNRDKYGNVLPASEFSQEEGILLHYIMAELKKNEDVLPSFKSVRSKLSAMLSQKSVAFPSLDYPKSISRKLFPIENISSIIKIASKETQHSVKKILKAINEQNRISMTYHVPNKTSIHEVNNISPVFAFFFDGGMYLNTLQAWNTRTLQDETLKKSWLIGELPASDCSDARDFWEHLLTGHALKPELIAKSGMPILAADDPRIQYIREESAIFEEVDNLELAEDGELAASPVVVPDTGVTSPSGTLVNWLKSIPLPELWPQEDIALAAGTEKHDIAVECHPYGRSEFVSIVFSPNEKELRVNIYTPDQSEPSSAFDSWELVAENGSVLGILRNGFCLVHDLEFFDGKCALRDPSGKEILCFEKQKTE